MESENLQALSPKCTTRLGDRYYDNEESPLLPREHPFASKYRLHSRLLERRRRVLKKALLEGVQAFDLEQYRTSNQELEKMNKGLRRFYEAQNEKLNDWLEVDALVYALADDVLDSMDTVLKSDGAADQRGPLQGTGGQLDGFLPENEKKKRRQDAKTAKWAILVNVVVNVLLLIAKIVALFFSSSLSLIASTTDSALDLLCTVIVWFTNRAVHWRLRSLQTRFPVGYRRLEPLGILVFSVIMVVSFIQILEESTLKLMHGGGERPVELPPVAIGAMVSNAAVKGLIGLLCRKIKTTQVQALVQDCKTDVYFNLASLLFPLLGNLCQLWWLDPSGAALLALYVVYDWADTCLQNISRLTGSSVSHRMAKKLMYLAWRFSPVVDAYKSLTAYHAGDGVWVEIDVLLDEKTPLSEAHDIAETLQYCLEGLEEVDRAFVTIDYSTLGPSGHVTASR